MEELLIGVGTLLAILGPLLIIPVTWVVYRAARFVLARMEHASERRLKRSSWIVAVGIVTGAITLSYLPGRLELERLCRLYGKPVISDNTAVDGFYRTRLFPYEAEQYLRDGFAFVEAPSPYDDSRLLRYRRRPDGSLSEDEIEVVSSLYGVDVSFETVRSGLYVTRKRIFQIGSDRQLGAASNFVYGGGPLSILLGAYGVASCPDPGTVDGAADFDTYYRFETLVLKKTE